MDINSVTVNRFGSEGPAAEGVRAAGAVSTAAAGDLPAAPVQAPAAAPSLPDLKSAIEAGSKALQGLNQSLEFQIDSASKQSVVKVVDTETNQVIRQIPSPEFLQMAQSIDAFQARLLNEKA